jgi:hypothetical protein
VLLSEASKLAARLKAAFPRMTLDEEEGDLFVKEISLLADPLVLNAAIDRIIRTSERFPTIAEVRAQYRASNTAGRYPALPETTGRTEIPEWVHVWRWHLDATRLERQTKNETSRQPIADRPPVPARDFPQMQTPGPNAYSLDEYEEIRQQWVEHGSPRFGVAEAIAV